MNKQERAAEMYDFEWVRRVIDSCIDVRQSRAADKLIRLFRIKYHLRDEDFMLRVLEDTQEKKWESLKNWRARS